MLSILPNENHTENRLSMLWDMRKKTRPVPFFYIKKCRLSVTHIHCLSLIYTGTANNLQYLLYTFPHRKARKVFSIPPMWKNFYVFYRYLQNLSAVFLSRILDFIQILHKSSPLHTHTEYPAPHPGSPESIPVRKKTGVPAQFAAPA